jgi:hypothetical protein
MVLRTLAATSAAVVLLFTSAPAEAARCAPGYYQCIRGGKALSPRRCCPIAKPKPPSSTLAPPRPGARCLSAVRDPGPGGSVKIKCVRWGSLTPRAVTCGA